LFCRTVLAQWPRSNFIIFDNADAHFSHFIAYHTTVDIISEIELMTQWLIDYQIAPLVSTAAQ
jgi:hypothetical protein